MIDKPRTLYGGSDSNREWMEMRMKIIGSVQVHRFLRFLFHFAYFSSNSWFKLFN